MSQTNPSQADLADLTTNIVVAYLSKHPVSQGDIAPLIALVHSALGNLGRVETPVEKLEPAVPIKKSITPDYLISLEDGRQYKSLKRHLSAQGLTPAEYRAKWDLPSSYPMVAANYAKQRSELAKSIGLGRKRKAPAPSKAPEQKGKSGRRSKAKA